MDNRTGTILEAAIREFIETGEPVSSGRLYDNYDFGIRPAMIRLVLDELEEEGYLEQPHHSAGRVPTDAGYEFFANRFLGVASTGSHLRQGSGGQAGNKESELKNVFERRAWPEFLDELSSELGLLSVVADLARATIYKAGLEALVDRLDWESRDEICSVIRDFEEVDKRLEAGAAHLEEGPNVFIGRKSPVTNSENLSVIAENYRVGNTTISIFAIGPKRMDYKKAIRIFRSL
jgi:transcriptional regulator of heat shock response